jgi:hypothetical protein
MNNSSTTLRNWEQASRELEFEFVSPFELRLPNGFISCFGAVTQFGGKRGLIIMLNYDEGLAIAAQEIGYGYSCLSDSDEPYDVDSFIEVLNDWGWTCETKAPPKWYSGQSWSE